MRVCTCIRFNGRCLNHIHLSMSNAYASVCGIAVTRQSIRAKKKNDKRAADKKPCGKFVGEVSKRVARVFQRTLSAVPRCRCRGRVLRDGKHRRSTGRYGLNPQKKNARARARERTPERKRRTTRSGAAQNGDCRSVVRYSVPDRRLRRRRLRRRLRRRRQPGRVPPRRSPHHRDRNHSPPATLQPPPLPSSTRQTTLRPVACVCVSPRSHADHGEFIYYRARARARRGRSGRAALCSATLTRSLPLTRSLSPSRVLLLSIYGRTRIGEAIWQSAPRTTRRQRSHGHGGARSLPAGSSRPIVAIPGVRAAAGSLSDALPRCC